MSTTRYPPDSDLRSLVRFCADKGLIWLDENRMLLMHTAVCRPCARSSSSRSASTRPAASHLAWLRLAPATPSSPRNRSGNEAGHLLLPAPSRTCLKAACDRHPVKTPMDPPAEISTASSCGQLQSRGACPGKYG